MTFVLHSVPAEPILREFRRRRANYRQTAEILGWYRRKVGASDPDGTRVRRHLESDTIPEDIAIAIVRAIGADPVDIGRIDETGRYSGPGGVL